MPLYTGFAEAPHEVQSITCLWEGNLDSQFIDYGKSNGCFDGFSFADRHYHTVQFASFMRSYPEDNPDQFYGKHQNTLRCWLRKFERDMRHLIREAEDKALILPEEYVAPQEEAFKGERTIKVSYRSIQSKITLREMDCLYLFCRGFTCPYIANLLGLSPRTVETHLESVKNRFGLFSRDDLAALAYANPLIQAYSPRLSVF